MFWFWFFVGPALMLAVFALVGERRRARFVEERLLDESHTPLPAASVIVPLSNGSQNVREGLAALASLDYPDYELIVAARKSSDIPPGTLPSRVKVALGGNASGALSVRGENLLAGIRASRKQVQIFAFADAGMRPGRNWLRGLAMPLARPDVGASTGYRWYAPEPPDFWSLMRSVWSAPIGGLMGPADNPFAWSGSMAMRKEKFFELRVPDLWRRSKDVEGEMARVIHRSGRVIAFAPAAMVADTGRIGALAFLSQARREMILARSGFPRLWGSALIAHVFYCGAMAAAVTASIRGSRGAEWALVAQLGLGMLKGVNRAALAKVELPDYADWFKRHAWVHALWVPLATWVWLGILLSSSLGRRAQTRTKHSDRPRASIAHG